jgi:hypothetical protein
MYRNSRRRFLRQTVGLGLTSATLPHMISRPARSQQESDFPERLLFVVAAAGGGSIIDSFLPVARTEVSSAELAATLVTHGENRIDQPAGSNIRCVKNRGGSVASLPPGHGLSQRIFLERHAADTAVMTVEGTSVNHRVAQKRSLTGAGANHGRTLMEAMSIQHGQNLLLPNCNMASDGYIEPGDDKSIPSFARAEAISDPRTFPLSTHGYRGITNAPSSSLINRARTVREQLEAASPFGHTFQDSVLRQDYLTNRSRMASFEDQNLISELTMVEEDPARYPLSQYGLESSEVADKCLGAFPKLQEDAFHAQGALAFLLARSGGSCAITLAPSFAPVLEGASIANTPLAFDFSHADHFGTQNLMWTRVLYVVDGLIDLLKSEYVNNDESQGTLWDRSLIYVATDFGRSKTRPSGSTSFGTGHHLNNGHVMVSPLLNGNQVYGGVDPETCLTYGFNKETGEPLPGTTMAEADVYGAICQAMNINFDGRADVPCMIRAS